MSDRGQPPPQESSSVTSRKNQRKYEKKKAKKAEARAAAELVTTESEASQQSADVPLESTAPPDEIKNDGDVEGDFSECIDCTMPLNPEDGPYFFQQNTDGYCSVYASRNLRVGARIMEEAPLHIHEHYSPNPVSVLKDELSTLGEESSLHFGGLRINSAIWDRYLEVKEAMAKGRTQKTRPKQPGMEENKYELALALEELLQKSIQQNPTKEWSRAQAIESKYFLDAMAILAVWESNRRFFNQSQTGGSFLGYHFSKLKHSCRPNAQYVFNEDTGKVTVHASRTIRSGEEITISFLHMHNMTNLAHRTGLLYTYFGFRCTRECCRGDDVAKRDEEREVICKDDEGLAQRSMNMAKRYPKPKDYLEDKELWRILRRCIQWCYKEHAKLALIVYFTIKARMLAFAHETRRSFLVLQKAYAVIVQCYGLDHPFTRKWLFTLKCLFSRRGEPENFAQLLQFHGGSKWEQPAKGAPPELAAKFRADAESKKERAAYYTADRVLALPWHGIKRERPNGKGPEA